MHAVLLAGGKGSRFAPLTARTPKVLLPVDGIPVIERIIRQLRDEGVVECTVVIGHLAERIKDQLGSGQRLGVHIEYLREVQPLDTAGCLGHITLSEPFLLINGDVVTDFRFTDLVKSREQAGSSASIAVCRRSLHVDYGVVERDDDGRMSGFMEKPSYNVWVNMGIYCFHPRVCRFVAPGERLSMPELLVRLQNAQHVVHCHPADAYWRDIGRAEDYLAAMQDFETDSKQLVVRHAA